MTSSSVKTVIVISSDGHEFEIAINVAKQSKLIKRILDDLDVSDINIPLYNMNSVMLAKVIEYCQKHADHESTVGDGVTNDANGDMGELKKWDAEFLKVDVNSLFEIILAANYLNIKGLYDLSCQAVADIIKDETPEQIRRIFNLKNDFSPREEEKIRKEDQWVFDE